MTIFFSLAVLVLSLFILLISLNYSVVNWEENKILSLSRKAGRKVKLNTINEEKDQFVFSNNSKKHNYHSLQLGSIQNYSDMKNAINLIATKKLPVLKTKFFDFIKTTLELSKPIKEVSDEFVEIPKEAVNQDHVVKMELPKIHKHEPKKHELHEEKKVEKDNPTATIGMESTIPNKDTVELSSFQKLEARLYEKLKQSGMSNYDIWLELGDLYHKYDDNKKAMEIYAVVSKHTKDEKQRQIAINKLIGL
jgi:hypothetical protein